MQDPPAAVATPGRRADPMAACDVAVVGGGPAGVVAALGLVRLGHAVVLIARARRLPLWEGLAPRAFEGLVAAGCTRALAAVEDEVVRQVTWNGVTESPNRERLVERTRFDRALRDDAIEHGVVVHATRALRCERHRAGWRVVTANGIAVEAPFLVEARGRDAPLGGARRRRGPATTALARAYHAPPGSPMTAVAACERGWAWLARAADGRTVLQLLVSSERGELGRGSMEQRYEDALRGLAEGREWLSGSRATSRPWARNAAPMLVTPTADCTRLRLGDAAAAIDPLSGHGTFEAIGAALAAAPVINTLVREPSRSEMALRFYRERVEQGFWRHCRVGRELYAAERRWARSPFWAARSRWPDAAPAHPPLDRSAPRIERRPVIADGLVREADVVVTPDHPRGVWQVAGVPLAPLIEALRETGHDRERAARRLERDPDTLSSALAWLAHRGMIDGPSRASAEASAPVDPARHRR